MKNSESSTGKETIQKECFCEKGETPKSFDFYLNLNIKNFILKKLKENDTKRINRVL